MRLALCLLVVLSALVVPSRLAAYDRYPEIDAIATVLANGRAVNVNCLTLEEAELDLLILSGASAYVEGLLDRRGRWYPFTYSVFDYGICEPLVALARGESLDSYDVGDVAWAILVLTHEAGHLRGHRWSQSESLTQRWALRHFRATAGLLGVVDPDASSLLLRYAVRIHRGMSDEYLAPSCRRPWVDERGLLRGCA